MTNRNRDGAVADGATMVGGCLLLLLIVAIIFLLGPLLVWLGWNIGVVALVAACGGSVGKISFVTAIFVSIALNIVGGVFRATTSSS